MGVENALTQLEQLATKQNDEIIRQKSVLENESERAEKFHAQLDGFEKSLAEGLGDLKNTIADESKTNQDRFLNLEQHIVAIPKNTGDTEAKSLGQMFVDSEEFKAVSANGRGRAVVKFDGIKNTITNTVLGTGVIPETRDPRIHQDPLRALTIRNLIPALQTTSDSIRGVREETWTNAAAPQAGQGVAKAESALDYETFTIPVQTIAHWLKVSDQVLSDFTRLAGIIDTRLRNGLNVKTEDQITTGDGTGNNLTGLTSEATAYDTLLNVVGDTKIDTLRHVILQASLANYPTEAVIVNPSDWESIELEKDTTDRYILGNPGAAAAPTIWGRPVVATTAVTAGDFIGGAFSVGCTIWDRMQSTIDVSTEDSDNFVKNLVTVRAENRICLEVQLPLAIVYGAYP